MKNIFKLTLLASALVTLLWSCEKDENKDFFKGGTAPALTASTNASADAISLLYENANNNAVTLKWTNPEYQFTTGVSSQDVTYTLEIDTAGANFTNPNKKQVVISKDLSLTIKESDLNDYLLNQLVLAPAVEHSLEFRVIATLGGGAVPLASNVLGVKATPYTIPPKVTPPADGELFITGSATPGNWMAGGDAPLTSQKFTTISPTLFQITIALSANNSYTFVPKYGNWDNKYSIKKKNDPDEVEGGDFQVGGEDILAPAASGNYKIEVDFQRGKFTVTKL